MLLAARQEQDSCPILKARIAKIVTDSREESALLFSAERHSREGCTLARAAAPRSNRRAPVEAGKRMTHIWHADERIAWPAERRGAADESCDPAAELARFGRLKTLRSLLQRLVTQHGGQGASAPPLAFERWLARAALHRAVAADPVLPAAAGVDDQLVADLAQPFEARARHRALRGERRVVRSKECTRKDAGPRPEIPRPAAPRSA